MIIAAQRLLMFAVDLDIVKAKFVERQIVIPDVGRDKNKRKEEKKKEKEKEKEKVKEMKEEEQEMEREKGEK